MANLNQIFREYNNEKFTENGDIAFRSTLNPLIDILFMSEYFQKHLDEVKIGNSDKEQLFSMFIRDPRFGLGRRDLGRKLMGLSECSFEQIVSAGRYDDVLAIFGMTANALDYLKSEIEKGNELAKKWMPRYSSKNLMMARAIAKYWGMNKQTYGKFIKSNTVEGKLSQKHEEEIVFEHVPSLAMIKYYKAFMNKPETSERFAKYLEDVKSGEKELKVSTTTVYDIYKNRHVIDPDLFFDKLEKISGSWIPVVDSSGSMQDNNDSYGKAMSIGHYLAKCSTYAPNTVISFSSRPSLLKLGEENEIMEYKWTYDGYRYLPRRQNLEGFTGYERELRSMYTGDCSNTDFGKVMELLKNLDKENAPEYIVVLSDMEFDRGSSMSKDETMKLFKNNGFNTKIVWWNFNSRATTVPEIDKNGNIYLSGYNPMLLKYLEAGFDGEQFLNKLLDEYRKKISA